MTKEQKEILEEIRTNDQHPERGEIEFVRNRLGVVFFARIIPNYWERWYENGQLRECSALKGGIFDGLYQRWLPNGQLQFRMFYKEGRLDGLRESWNEGGVLEYRENYKEGKKEGLAEKKGLQRSGMRMGNSILKSIIRMGGSMALMKQDTLVGYFGLVVTVEMENKMVLLKSGMRMDGSTKRKTIKMGSRMGCLKVGVKRELLSGRRITKTDEMMACVRC